MVKLIKKLSKKYYNNMLQQPVRIKAGITNIGILSINKGSL
jgi:hypothetical protein